MSQRAVLNLCHLRALLCLDSLAGKRLVGGRQQLGNLEISWTSFATGTEPKQPAWYNSLASF
jgi:hypothetical protein